VVQSIHAGHESKRYRNNADGSGNQGALLKIDHSSLTVDDRSVAGLNEIIKRGRETHMPGLDLTPVREFLILGGTGKIGAGA
jgi:hypothetical protein